MEKMKITDDNYYTAEAHKQYMSVTQYKNFAGSAGRRGCEAMAMAMLEKEWVNEPNTAMLVGSYVDAYYEGTLDKFKAGHPELFKKDGDLKAEYKQADQIIERSLKDTMFQGFMAGEKQKIMTGRMFGTDWKIKMDSYVEGKFICDLKVVQQIFEDDRLEPKSIWVRDTGYMDFMKYWGYDIQGAVYQEIVYQNTGKRLPFFIAALDRQKETGLAIFHIDDQCLRDAMTEIEHNMPRILDLKAGLIKPDRCELCDYCRHTKVLTNVIEIHSDIERKNR